ncbi:TetR/AcrR family transcriptional regulator [Streptomyces sp. 8L]|uniref:TetR/AcrR family transcriptional regulator n=1 Tax=Streptomyces sp. 8L TaxID=2877242 RepID=UPI001CD69958|nr:TetR family transcriptional regulator [Streptomyces sp. 8L]MCA1223145.1 TetR family transcriptional regulator [Streptomyces sp. 8L]
MATPFQRARSEEQRAVRRQAILDTAAAMLTELPVAQVSLNELSRRVGLAKSNVLRYFESREAVLLELLDQATRAWLTELEGALATAVDPAAGARERVDRLAGVFARTLEGRPVLCELAGAQAAVLERNVSTAVAATYKRAGIETTSALADLFHRRLPELDDRDALRLAAGSLMVAASLWTHAHPSAAVRAVYDTEPELAVMRVEFRAAVEEFVAVIASGALARSEGT